MSSARVFSIEVPGTEDPAKGWGPIHRSVDGQEPTIGIFDPEQLHTVMTSYENFHVARRKFASRPFLGHRPFGPNGEAGDYAWSTYEEVGRRVDNFGSGLEVLGLCPPTGDPELRGRGLLGLFSKNRPEWVIAEQGGFTQAVISVPMYDTLGADGIAYVINQTGLTTIVCSAETMGQVVACKERCPTLKNVIQMEPASPELKEKTKACGLQALGFDEVEAAGSARPQITRAPDPEDIFTFCYTSGTTGDPKGALIPHGCAVTASAAMRARPTLVMKPTDVHLSYLPLPHIFERIVHFCLVRMGAAIGFYQGETLKIVDDLVQLRPTFFPSVPRLLNRIHDRLRAGVEEAGGAKKALFERAYNAKKKGLLNGRLTHSVWDRLVFAKIKKRVGLDRIRCIVTGSAPIADHVLEFLRIVFGCVVVEGYGLSETTAGGTITFENDLQAGTVGGPLACNECRLQDVPEMGYLRTDQVHGNGDGAIPCHGRGEICFKGRAVFKGYHKMPEQTQEAIDSDGWFHTGDIGLWTPDGRLKIIDRKKNIFKLAQGEYVAPEKVENLNAQSAFVMQNFVYGDSLKTQLVAIVVVDHDAAKSWANSRGIRKDLAALCRDEEFKQEILADIRAIASRAKLQGFEVVQAVHLEHVPWEPAGGILTPTFKLQRHKALATYQAHIKEMYARLEASAPANSKL